MKKVLDDFDDAPVRVPRGEYNLAYIGYETKRIFNAEKLYMYFRIVTQGTDFGKELKRHYGVTLYGKPGKGGRYSAGWHSDLMMEYVTLFNVRPRRKSEIPITPFKEHIIRGRVETVTTNRRQRPIPKLLQYSKIAELIKVVD